MWKWVPENPTDFTRYVDRYEMVSLSAGMLVGKNLYPLSRRVYGWVLPILVYPRVKYNRIILLLSIIKHILAKTKYFSRYYFLTKLCNNMVCYNFMLNLYLCVYLIF